MIAPLALALLLISPSSAEGPEDAAIIEKKLAAAEKGAASAADEDIKKKKERAKKEPADSAGPEAKKPLDPDALLKKIKKEKKPEALSEEKEPPGAAPQEAREAAEDRTRTSSPRRTRTSASRSGAASSQRAAETSTPEATREADASAPAPERRVDRALKKVKSAGRAWTASSEDSTAGPTEPGLPAERKSDLASPSSDRDLALAAGTGLRGTFTDLGLKPGPAGGPAVVHEDGAPATPREVEQLKEAIAAQPRALLRRPDFFQVVPRREFDRVKRAAAAPAGEPALRHIGLSEDRRDVVRSFSCSPLSGGCNPYAGVTSYKRGDFVPPEEIFRISRALPAPRGSASAEAPREKESSLYEELTADEEASYREWLEAADPPAPKQSVFKDIRGLLASIGGAFGQSASVERGAQASAGGDTVRTAERAREDARAIMSAAGVPREALGSSAAVPAGAESSGNEAPPPRRAGPWIWALAAGAAALLLLRTKRS